MKNLFLAKTSPKKTIKEHTDDLLALFTEFKKTYGNYFTDKELELIKIAIEVHDLGKMNSRFQNKIYKALNMEYKISPELDSFYQKEIKAAEIPHGFLSPAFIDINSLLPKYGDESVKALINAVYNHHIREDNFKNMSLRAVIENDIMPYLMDFPFSGEIQVDYIYDYMVYKVGQLNTTNEYSYSLWLKYVVIKGVLNRLDYAASSELEMEIAPDYNGKYICDYVTDKWKNLRDVQQYMKDNNDKNIVVIASTGIGKTEGALLWINRAKGFYTLPLKVSINAIYERIIDKKYGLGYPEDKVTLLHSDALSYFIDNNAEYDTDPFVKTKQARMLAYPLTVCTIDQLFRFVFKYIGCEVFPATLKYSKLVIDEIQMYAPDVTAYILYGLKVINDLNGKFAIVTATFPPVLKYFLVDRLGIDFDMPKPFYSDLRHRHLISYQKGDFDYDRIRHEAKNKKVLVLCNTVQNAQKVYKMLNDIDNVHLLHSYFVGKDRKLLEKSIKEFSDAEGVCGVWVSTQIVEASLDIDFDILFTEMCTADSLLQRMGRCYRKRNYSGSTPNIYIYDNQSGVGTVYDRDIYGLSVKYLEQYCNRIFTEEEKQDYINCVYSVENTKETEYFKTIETLLRLLEKYPPAEITKDTAEKQFRNINSITAIPDKEYNVLLTNGKLDEFANSSDMNAKERLILQRELQSYTLSLNLNDYRTQKVIDKTFCKAFEPMKVVRCKCKYEFDKNTLSGRGLVFDELESTLL